MSRRISRETKKIYIGTNRKEASMNLKQARDYIKRLKKLIKKLRAEAKGTPKKKTGGSPAGSAQKK